MQPVFISLRCTNGSSHLKKKARRVFVLEAKSHRCACFAALLPVLRVSSRIAPHHKSAPAAAGEDQVRRKQDTGEQLNTNVGTRTVCLKKSGSDYSQQRRQQRDPHIRYDCAIVSPVLPFTARDCLPVRYFADLPESRAFSYRDLSNGNFILGSSLSYVGRGGKSCFRSRVPTARFLGSQFATCEPLTSLTALPSKPQWTVAAEGAPQVDAGASVQARVGVAEVPFGRASWDACGERGKEPSQEAVQRNAVGTQYSISFWPGKPFCKLNRQCDKTCKET